MGKTSLHVPGSNVTSVSVSPLEKGEDGFNRLLVGMEPSVIFSSSYGGQAWEKIDEFNKLPSSSAWSFPPRPWTHHVRWIEHDVNKKGYVFVAIEAGALIQSLDGGKSWIDRVEHGPYDTHVLRRIKSTPKGLYSAAGDGYFESLDYGDTWENSCEGLGHHTYLGGIAINSGDPQNMIVSAPINAWKAHSREDPESFVYRYSSGDKKWNLVTDGLLNSKGTIISILGIQS